jgi:tRNA(Ile)-lysidine synthase
MVESKVEALLKRHSFTLENKSIVVGVSGGPDSLALLHYLWGKREKETLSIAVAHVDHMFRGQESLDDALYVKQFCERYEIPFEMARINVPEIMEQTGKSSQVAAREARYEFFLAVMERYGFSYLALGHHGDDQVETMLMRFTRGSTGKARAGIPFIRPFHNGFIFRPFLSITKEEIEHYCALHHLQPRYDPSNKKDIYSRNRFRKEVLPFLKAENPHVHEHFQRFSEEMQSDEDFLEELTVQELNTVMRKREESKIAIDINCFLDMPLPLQRRGIQLILNYLYKKRPSSLSAIHIDQIFTIIHHRQPSGKLDLPDGLKIIRSYHHLSFQFEEVDSLSYCFEIHEPEILHLPNGGVIQLDVLDKEPADTNDCSIWFSRERVTFPLTVRTRKKGDRMSLKGMAGTKKLKDIFIDHKVPIHERDGWPVITDGDGTIIWLPGLKKSALAGIDYSANQYILLTYSK